MVLLYGLLCLSAISEAILLYTTFAVAPMPPATEKTRGENDPHRKKLQITMIVIPNFSLVLQPL